MSRASRRTLVSHKLRPFDTGDAAADQNLDETLRDHTAQVFEKIRYFDKYTLDNELTDAEAAATVTPIDFTYPEGHLYRYGRNTTPGTTDMTSAMQNAALVHCGRLIVPEDDILVTAATPLLSNTQVIGGGYFSHILTTTTNLTAIFTIEDQSNVKIERVRFEGNNTSSSSGNGVGVYFTDSDDVEINRCLFTLFRGSPIRIQGDDSGGHDNFRISNCFFYGNKSASPSENGEISVAGGIRSVRIVRSRFEADATNPYPRGVFVANNGSTLNWAYITLDDCYFNGYAHNAFGCTDEDPGVAFDNGIVQITNCIILNTIQSGIKLKNNRACIITGNYFEGCDTVPETAGSLQGTIFVNACQDTTVDNNVIISAGTDGIRIVGLETAAGGTTAGYGRANMNVANNVIESADESGIFATNDLYESVISDNAIRGCGIGIRVTADSGKPCLSVTIANNIVRGSVSNGDGINVSSPGLVSVKGLIVTGNQIKLCGGFGILAADGAEFVISDNIVMDNGVGGVNTSGIRAASVSDLVVSGNRAGNSVATDQDYGLDFGAAVTDAVITSNNFTGNQVLPTQGLTQDAMIYANIGLSNNNDTAAHIADKTNVINTAGKYSGKTVFDTTNGRLMTAIGATDVSQWYIADGSGSVTPV